MCEWNARYLVIRKFKPFVVNDRDIGRVLVMYAQNAIDRFYNYNDSR